MTPETVTKSITSQATPTEVWRAITDPEAIERWLSDEAIAVISDWEVGSALEYRGTLHGLAYRAKGTIRRFEPGRVLEYDYWSAITGLLDAPENYSVIRFELGFDGTRTTLTVTQDNLQSPESVGHVNFFWTSRLPLIKGLAEAATKEGTPEP